MATQLLIFGDSWANADTAFLQTWPEQMGERCGLETLNLAVAGSTSKQLANQFQELQKEVERGLDLDPDAIAVIHTGGNDLYFSSPRQLVELVCASLAHAACCGRALFLPKLLERLSEHLVAFVRQLRGIGVRHVLVSSIPLSASIPLISEQFMELAPHGGRALGAAAMGAVNRLQVATLERALARTSGGLLAGAHGGGSAPAAGFPLSLLIDETCVLDELCCRVAAGEGYWADHMHPSQLLHSALCDEVVKLVAVELRRCHRPGEHLAETLRALLLARGAGGVSPVPEALLRGLATPEQASCM